MSVRGEVQGEVKLREAVEVRGQGGIWKERPKNTDKYQVSHVQMSSVMSCCDFHGFEFLIQSARITTLQF